MARRGGSFSGSAVLGLIVLQSLVAPPSVHRGSGRRSFGTACPIAAEVETTAGSTCATSAIVHGYECQEFEVTTEDGYILGLQRIPKGRNKDGGVGGNRRPVIVQHGVLADGKSWLLNQPEQNLPFILAESGFDVWLANTRGTSPSLKHTRLHPLSQAFWQWSWDELVTYDLPAVFDFVYQQTGQTQKIDFVGHSLGTLTLLASLSEGRLLDKLNSAALLSPIAYLSHMKTVLGKIAAKMFLGEIIKLLGVAEFNPKGVAAIELVRPLCQKHEIDCNDLLTAISGKNCCLNSSSDVYNYQFQSTSMKNMIHLSQTVRSGVVSKYSYESAKLNFAHYSKATPPIYNLSNIPHNFPLFMSYGGQDSLSDVRDVQDLLNTIKLHDADKLHVQFVKEYAHLDFVMGFNAKDVVFNSVVSFFKQQK